MYNITIFFNMFITFAIFYRYYFFVLFCYSNKARVPSRWYYYGNCCCYCYAAPAVEDDDDDDRAQVSTTVTLRVTTLYIGYI